ncbi:MAG TPA: hypothetical protein VFH27_13275 [Longimicrobiaceae bacterium]|nr:hypothetical protein [Longimicrobiaceae bacterium]
MTWSPNRLDRLERAISDGSRVQVSRRGTEYVVVPRGLHAEYGSEVLTATHPNTGDEIEFRLDEIDWFDIIG